MAFSANVVQFTLDKLARRMGVFLQRRLDQMEIQELIFQVYQELVDTYQWSFLFAEGTLVTDAVKDKGSINVLRASPIVNGFSTFFTQNDIGKQLHCNAGKYNYEVITVNEGTQQLLIQPAYVDESQ